MNKYEKQILTQFNHNNHIRVKRIVNMLSEDYKVLTETPNEDGELIATNKSPGLYRININGISYIINISDTITSSDELHIKDQYNIYYTIDGIKKYIIPYEYIGPDSRYGNIMEFKLESGLKSIATGDYIINNTVDDILDGLSVVGNSIMTFNSDNEYDIQSPYNPAELNSISSFTVTTKNVNIPEKNYSLKINLKNNIKRLPSGISDIFIMDSVRKEAYIIYRIGKLILTGNEAWEIINSTDKYCIFFMQYDHVSTGMDDTSINCNYFPSITDTKMNTDDKITYAISNSNNENKRGIYIRIPVDIIESQDIDGFKNYLKNVFKTTPIVVEYLLYNNVYKSVLLDEYCIKQFYDNTTVSLDINTQFACFAKVLDIDREI